MSIEKMSMALDVLGYSYSKIASYVITHDLESISAGIEALYNELSAETKARVESMI